MQLTYVRNLGESCENVCRTMVDTELRVENFCFICVDSFGQNLKQHVLEYHRNTLALNSILPIDDGLSKWLNKVVDAGQDEVFNASIEDKAQSDSISSTKIRNRYACPLCPYSRADAAILLLHLKARHTKMSAYVAPVDCSDQIDGQSKSNKQKRSSDHTCSMCQCAFQSSVMAQAHVVQKHLSKPMWKCSICEHSSRLKSGVRVHCKTKHPGQKAKFVQIRQNAKELRKLQRACFPAILPIGIKSSFKGTQRNRIYAGRLNNGKEKSGTSSGDTGTVAVVRKDENTKEVTKGFCHVCTTCGAVVKSAHLQIHVVFKHWSKSKPLWKCPYCDHARCNQSNVTKHVQLVHSTIKQRVMKIKEHFDEMVLLKYACFPAARRIEHKALIKSLEISLQDVAKQVPQSDLSKSLLDELSCGKGKKTPEKGKKRNKNMTTGGAGTLTVMCALCHKVVRRRCLQQHVIYGHATEPLFQCGECDVQSKLLIFIKRHSKSVHCRATDAKVVRLVDNWERLRNLQKQCFPGNLCFARSSG